MKPFRLACFCTILLSTMALAQSNPVPLINNPLVPASAAPGGTGFTLTVNGTGFVSGSVVNWNGTALATTFVDSSQLTATVPGSNIAKAAAASVTVANPAPGGGISNFDFFETRQPFTAVAFGQSALSLGGPVTEGIITADLNGDGKLDLAVIGWSNGNFGSIFVLLGNGDSTFQTPVPYPVGRIPLALLAADFNGDGHLDLAFTNYGSDDNTPSLSVMLGKGDGTFSPPQDSTFDGEPAFGGTAVGDFNADGKLDIAVTEQIPTSQVFILLGNGDGTFQAPVGYAAGNSGAIAVTTGDFNGDGKLDLAVGVLQDLSVAVLIGNGDGTFQSAVEYSTMNGVPNVVTADYNGDGILDLVADGPGNFSVLLGNGDGTFQGAVLYPTGRHGHGSIADVDVNGDGKVDIIAGEESTVHNATLLGNGDGTFQKAQPFSANESTGLCCIVAGDFNNDGLMDLAQSGGLSIVVFPAVTSVLSTTQVNFGTVKAGSSVTRRVTLNNIGNASFTITKIKFKSKQARANWNSTNDCPSSLASHATCTFTIVFKPSSKGRYGAEEIISDSAVTGLQTVALEGTGTN